jgi:hypothetical protein
VEWQALEARVKKDSERLAGAGEAGSDLRPKAPQRGHWETVAPEWEVGGMGSLGEHGAVLPPIHLRCMR